MVVKIGHRDADAFEGVTRRLKKVEATLAKLDGIAIFDRRVRKPSARAFTEINARPGALGKLMMTQNEIGVEMRFDNVLNL